MEVSDELIRECTRRLMLSRMRILCNNGFYGLLLMHAKMGISDANETAWVEWGERITFNPEFMKSLSDSELDYVMMHEILHIILEHLERMEGLNPDIYNIAADIVVNSNILRSCGGNLKSISLSAYGGEQMHKAPDGSEGWMHSAEEVYEMVYKEVEENQEYGEKLRGQGWDIHIIRYEEESDDGDEENNKEKDSSSSYKAKREFWKACVLQAAEALAGRRNLEENTECGGIPGFTERYLEKIKKTQTDWRTVLDEFIQEDIVDYSFMPPDRRISDSPFFLPDFNEKDDRIENILFMIDTSGSMSDNTITTVYSEVRGAIDQFGGKLEGWLGFFDACVIEPKAFSSVEEFEVIRPQGGGGTSFEIIFKYVNENVSMENIMSIVILTDGYAPFPEERETHGTPVLWIITNEDVNPPWGKVARIQTIMEADL